MNIRILTFIMLGSLFAGKVYTQELLTLEQAIAVGLENNYGIRIARNNETFASNNNTYGNAGYLPRVTTSGSVGYTSNNTVQKFFSGDERSGKGAGNTALRGGIELTWTAFDGFRMYAVKDRLDLVEQKSKSFTEKTMHDLASQIQILYSGLVRITQQMGIREQSIQLNESLRDLAANKVKIGTGTSLEILQTTNRLNADSSALLNIKEQLTQAKISLNRLIGREPTIDFIVPAEMAPVLLPATSELNQMALAQNYNIRLLNYDEQIALAQIKEEKSALYPTVNINSGYNYSFSKSEVGFLLSNRSYGPTIGLTLNYNLFPGRNLKKDIANGEIIKDNIVLTKEDLVQDIESNIAGLYQDYLALQDLLELETRNLQTAETNTSLAQQLYQSGRATNFDVREAILSETQIRDRISDVQYRQKLVEIQIKSVAGIPMYNVN